MKKHPNNTNEPCPKCGGKMTRGVALQNVATGIGDFSSHDDCVTMSYGEEAKIIPVIKCTRCGFSVRE